MQKVVWEVYALEHVPEIGEYGFNFIKKQSNLIGNYILLDTLMPTSIKERRALELMPFTIGLQYADLLNNLCVVSIDFEKSNNEIENIGIFTVKVGEFFSMKYKNYDLKLKISSLKQNFFHKNYADIYFDYKEKFNE